MRLVIAVCSVDYVGRLTAHLPEATRLLLVKADGSVSIHADDRAYKPLMWMSPPCTTLVQDGLWTITNKGGEQLVITVGEVLHDSAHELGADPGLVKDGVEKHLQELLAGLCDVLGEGVKGVLAAQSFKPQAKVLAADRGITCIQLDYDALRGMDPSTPTLF